MIASVAAVMDAGSAHDGSGASWAAQQLARRMI
jgi:hypothetical protein